MISIHALREEGDAGQAGNRRRDQYFYPRPPRGGRRAGAVSQAQAAGISIHALREEGDFAVHSPGEVEQISIHALREEGDLQPPADDP